MACSKCGRAKARITAAAKHIKSVNASSQKPLFYTEWLSLTEVLNNSRRGYRNKEIADRNLRAALTAVVTSSQTLPDLQNQLSRLILSAESLMDIQFIEQLEDLLIELAKPIGL